MRNASADRANVIASPTVIFAAVLVLGFGLDMFWPAPFLPEGWGLSLGLIVIFAAVNVKLFAAREMVRVKTNLNIRKPANDIATSGLYGVSRNPLYIGMILLNTGIGCIVNSLWILLLSAGLAAALQKGVIEPEEAYLEQKFGDKYMRYKAKVRRWI
jgi:protein-S-isoprenylcysteine O-methyltransferase Ste14